MKKIKTILMLLSFLLVSCSGQSLNNYANETPTLNLRSFFNGKIEAQGIVQDRSGKVIKRFNVDINASWKGDVGTIDEKFVYSDSTTGARVWTLKEVSPQSFEGRAHDVIGTALGNVKGNTFFFEYKLDVPVGNSNYSIHFEDWMYLLNEKTLMARTKMTKWGFGVGEVTIIMNKKDNL